MDNAKKKKEKEEYGAEVCSNKMAFLFDNWVRKPFKHPKKIVGEYIKEGDVIIDLGCGPGFFTTEMAKLAGAKGKVIAVDLQQEMLDMVNRKAASLKLSDRISLHKCESDRVGPAVEEKADFILAYYMVHETPSQLDFLKEVRAMLKTGGRFLVVEPTMHVKREKFREMLEMAKEAGFTAVDEPRKKGGRSVLFTV
ncbi:MAG: class I SAM-dependent methyltransferase [bacterium]|nr:class I SAM-dependent methyltransferase [bacterium]